MEALQVLLVDDEEEFIFTLAERLKIRGIEALTATDGEQALAVIDKHRPPVVVLDILMPGLGGLEVLSHIKRNHPRIEVILLTGQGSTHEGIEGMRLGAFDFMIKPVKIEDLIKRMTEALEKSRGADD